MKNKKSKWSLSLSDVKESGGSSCRSGRKKASQTRALDIRDAVLILTHTPSGVTVEGEIPEGHYSKKEMLALKSNLREKLLKELELKAARALKIKGY